MGMSPKVRLMVLSFFHAICIFFCGWFGISNVILAKKKLATKNLHKMETADTLLNGGAASIAFALMAIINLWIIFVPGISKNKICKSSIFKLVSHISAMTLVLLGAIVVVMLGQISAIVGKTEDGDIGLVSAVIACVLICMLIQVSSIDFSENCCRSPPTKASNRQVDPGDEELMVFSKTVNRKEDETRGKFFNSQNQFSKFETEVATSVNIDQSSPSKTATIHRYHTLPGLKVTASELDSAKKKLRRSTTASSSNSSSGSWPNRPLSRLETLVEGRTSEEQATGHYSTLRPWPRFSASANFSAYSGDDDVFLPASNFQNVLNQENSFQISDNLSSGRARPIPSSSNLPLSVLINQTFTLQKPDDSTPFNSTSDNLQDQKGSLKRKI